MNYTQFHGQFQPQVDRVLRDYFPSDPGVMVDVGAAVPVQDNNSYHFERNGWDVYCIEANPAYVEQLRAVRKNVIECAAGESDRDAVFTIVDFYGTNNWGAGSGLRLDPRLMLQESTPAASYRPHKVRVRSISSLVDEGSIPEKIDLLSVDTEGTECDVLRGVDFGRHRPRVIVCENNFDDADCREFLAPHGYRLHQRIHINDFFVRTDR